MLEDMCIPTRRRPVFPNAWQGSDIFYRIQASLMIRKMLPVEPVGYRHYWRQATLRAFRQWCFVSSGGRTHLQHNPKHVAFRVPEHTGDWFPYNGGKHGRHYIVHNQYVHISDISINSQSRHTQSTR